MTNKNNMVKNAHGGWVKKDVSRKGFKIVLKHLKKLTSEFAKNPKTVENEINIMLQSNHFGKYTKDMIKRSFDLWRT